MKDNLSHSIVSACKGTKKNTTMQIPCPKNHFILLPPRINAPLMPITDTYSRRYPIQTNSRPSRTIPVLFPYNSRTIPVLFPYNKADHEQRRSRERAENKHDISGYNFGKLLLQ